MDIYKAKNILKSIKQDLMKIDIYNRPSTADAFDTAIRTMELRELDGLVLDIPCGTPKFTPPPMPHVEPARDMDMVAEITWSEFRESGLLWWINTMLHTFGMAICMEFNEEEYNRVYPARVKFRGFSEDIVSEGYIKVSNYMAMNAARLVKESQQ